MSYRITNICLLTEVHYKGGLDTFIINLVNSWPCPSLFTIYCNCCHPGLENLTIGIKKSVHFETYSLPRITWLLSSYTNHKPLSRFGEIFVSILRGIIRYFILLPYYILYLSYYFYSHSYNTLFVVNGGHPGSIYCQAAVIAWFISGKHPRAIYNFHSSVQPSSLLLGMVQSVLDLILLNTASSFITVSRNCMESFYQSSLFISNSFKISFVYNGIEDPFPMLSNTNTNFSKEFTLAPNEKPYCLMLSTFERGKGHHFLIKVVYKIVSLFPDFRLIICGYGSTVQKQIIIDDIKSYGLEQNIDLLDFQPNPFNLIYNAQMLLVPSQSYESFGLTIIEAMSLKTPVVTSDIGGMPEVIFGTDAGYVCSIKSIDEFYERIISILSRPAMARELGDNGRKAFLSRYSSSTMARKYYRFISTPPSR